MNTANSDVIDLADLARSLRHRWRMIAGFVLAGALASLAVLLFVQPRYTAKSSIILKMGGGSASTSSLAAAIGAMAGGAASSGGVGALVSGRSGVETEIEILQSRGLAATVVDSLGLQVDVNQPWSTPARAVIASASLPGSFRKRVYTFARTGAVGSHQYSFSGPGDEGRATVGQPTKLLVGTIVIAATAPSRGFRVTLYDREDAITRVLDQLDAGKPKSDVVHLELAADDSLTAAAGLNLLVDEYFLRRKGIDRGLNQRRAEFLADKLDSVGRALAVTERALRRQQEAAGVVDPEVVGRSELETATRLRQQLTDLKVQEGALQQLISQIRDGTASVKQLAGYPQYLTNGTIVNIVNTLIGVETEREAALRTVTENDLNVRTLTERQRSLEGQLMPLAQTTLDAMKSQHESVQRQLDTLQNSMATLPGASETYTRLQRDVLDQGRIYAALQTQLVDARLAAITEGGDVRVLDSAAVPKFRSFPRRSITMLAGTGTGLMLGIFVALLLGVMGGSMVDARDVERRTGLPAVRFEPTAPLLVQGQFRAVLVAPINARANPLPVAQRLVETAMSRGMTSTLLDLSRVVPEPGEGEVRLVASPITVEHGANESINRLSETNDLVVVMVPAMTSRLAGAVISSSRPVVLVAPERRVDRAQLDQALDTLRRIDAPIVGVVLSGDDRRSERVS